MDKMRAVVGLCDLRRDFCNGIVALVNRTGFLVAAWPAGPSVTKRLDRTK
jgi:hypothetical protein